LPSRSLVNVIFLPSGDTAGTKLLPDEVSCTPFVPSAFITMIWRLPMRRVKTIFVPLGEKVGS
jgi:hypothetical protein